MSCRTKSWGKAATAILRDSSRLRDVQVLSLVHEVRRATAGSATPAHEDDVAAAVALYRNRISAMESRGSTQVDVQRYLQDVESGVEATTVQDLRVWLDMPRRVAAAEAAQDAHVMGVALTHAAPVADVEAAYDAALQYYGRQSSPARRYVIDTDGLPFALDGLPSDWRTITAMEGLYRHGAARCPSCGQFLAAMAAHSNCTAVPVGEPLASWSPLAGSVEQQRDAAVGNDVRAQVAAEHAATAGEVSAVPAIDTVTMSEAGSDPGVATSVVADQDWWQRSQAAAAAVRDGDHRVPYVMEAGALGGMSTPGGPRSFGLELEVDCPDELPQDWGTKKRRLALALYEAGLSQHSAPQVWHYIGRTVDTRGRPMGGGFTADSDGWVVEFDRTVDGVDGVRGCEVKSPIMWDTAETWQNLKKVCDILDDIGFSVTVRTGLHVNVGASDFNHTVDHHNRLLKLSDGYEDVLLRMATDPVRGQHRGRTYCQPVVVGARGYRSVGAAKAAQGPTYQAAKRRFVNLQHLPDESSDVETGTRVEVRLFDASVDPGRLQAAIRASVGLVQGAVDGRTAPRTPARAGSYADTPATDDGAAMARSFIEMAAGSDDRGRGQLAWMFGQAPWQRAA